MDAPAHRTLLLRSFYRQFVDGAVPPGYYEYVRGEFARRGRGVDDLLDASPNEGRRAREEAWRAELRPSIASEVDARIRQALGPERSRSDWVLVGGPPCQAYSLVGRARMLGARGDDFYYDKRHTLYREYLRIIAKHRPSVFVMENVKGLLSAKSQLGFSIFERILKDLRQPPDSKLKYRLFGLTAPAQERSGDAVEPTSADGFLIKSERFGVPQARHRLIIVGVLQTRFGAGMRGPAPLSEGADVVRCADAIGDLPALRSGLSREADSSERWVGLLKASVHQAWFRQIVASGQSEVAEAVRSALDRVRCPRSHRGAQFVACEPRVRFERDWFEDPRLGGACNHETRAHIYEDLSRYLFVSSYGKAKGRSPRIRDFPESLLPEHANVASALRGAMFNDRFRVQLSTLPASTITSHIAKDGHYFIHPDPAQCRSLTVREAARLQTFPDNYFFEGNRTEQYRQVGNAVPPLLARGIASAIKAGFERGWQ